MRAQCLVPEWTAGNQPLEGSTLFSDMNENPPGRAGVTIAVIVAVITMTTVSIY